MTAKKAQAGPPFGPSAIAAHWAKNGLACSRQYADKCIRALGCPTDSLDAALVWRTARTVAGSRSQGGNAGADEAASNRVPVEIPIQILGNSLAASLARARQTEEVQYQVWREAVKCGDVGAQTVALRNHKDAQQNLIAIEARITDERKARGELLDLIEAQNRIADRLSPLRAARATLSKVLAMAFFPEAPHRAQLRIEEELARVLDPAVIAAARPLVAA